MQTLMMWELGTRADKAHVALDDIHELRQLIQLEFTKNCAYPRNSAVTLHRDTRAAFRFGNHSSEFVNRK